MEKNNNREVTANDLISKLGKEAAPHKDAKEPVNRQTFLLPDEQPEDSANDLDINELIRKYLPELGEENADGTVSADDLFTEMKNGEVTSSPVKPNVFGEGVFSEYEIGDKTEDDEPFVEKVSEPMPAPVKETAAKTEELVQPEADEIPAEEDEAAKTMSFLEGLLHNNAGGSGAAEALAKGPATTEDNADDGISLSDGLFSKAEAPAVELPESDGKADNTDINLMIAFDMDAEDDETAAKAKEIGDKLESKTATKTKKVVLERPEYVDKSQAPTIRKEFKKKRTLLIIRTVICALLGIGLFVFENLASLTKLFTGSAMQFAGAVDPALYPVVYIMVSLQLMLLACLCALPEILAGFKALFSGSPRPESMTSLMTVAGILYSVVLCNLIKSPNEPVMLNFVVALYAFFTLICALLNNKREIMNFRIISNKKAKHVVHHMAEEESECETEAFGATEENCDVMKIEKTDFINNFFTRLATPDSTTGTTVTLLMSIAVATGVIFGLFMSFRGQSDGALAWRTAFAAMYAVAPLSVFLMFSYPFYRANRAAQEYDSAIVGETSLEEYSNASILTFEDKSVFPSYSVKVQNIRIYNNARIDRVLYYAASVFATAGGPLQDVFEIATKDMGISENVRIFDTEAGLLVTEVDGVNIIFGNYEALTSRGFEIQESAAEDDVDLSEELSIMYMFREDKLVAKMYIKYDMDEDIDVILKQFAGDGLYVCVRTFDPNINETMIAKKLDVKKMPLKVVRYHSPDEVGKYEEKVDSGLVTCSSPKSLLQVISYCERVLNTRKTNVALAILSLAIGAAALLLLLLSGSMNLLSSLLIGLYQLVWLIPTVIASKIFIR